MNQRRIKVWNKTVIINDVPDYYTDEELIAWAKKRLLLDGIVQQGGTAS